MKKIIRKGFSIIELIFVMVILAAMAIPSMRMSIYSDDEKQTLTQMRYDLENVKYLIFKDYFNKKDFTLVIPTTTVAKAITGAYIYNENMIDIKVISEDLCTNKIEGDNIVGNGFEIKIYNKKIPNKALKFNSCVDNKIELIDIK